MKIFIFNTLRDKRDRSEERSWRCWEGSAAARSGRWGHSRRHALPIDQEHWHQLGREMKIFISYTLRDKRDRTEERSWRCWEGSAASRSGRWGHSRRHALPIDQEHWHQFGREMNEVMKIFIVQTQETRETDQKKGHEGVEVVLQPNVQVAGDILGGIRYL